MNKHYQTYYFLSIVKSNASATFTNKQSPMEHETCIKLELKTDLCDSLSWSMVASSNDGISPLILGTCWIRQKQFI